MSTDQALAQLRPDQTEALSVALAGGNALQTIRAVEALAARVIGFRMMTVMVYHSNTCELERVYSNSVQKYPTGGRKFKAPSPWKAQLLDAAAPVLSNNTAAVRENFEDYETLFSLGISAILNIPIQRNGKCIGTLNFGHQANWFTNQHIQMGLELATYLEPGMNNH